MTDPARLVAEGPLVAFTALGEPQTAGSKTTGVRKDGTRFVRQDDKTGARPGWKREIRQRAAEAMQGRALLTSPIRLDVAFFRPRPRGHYNSKGQLNATGLRKPYPATRPDVDKLVRLLADELKGICWHDDGQVVQLRALKLWGEPARAVVEVREA